MLKIIRSNKKFVLAGLMILSMLTFVVNRGNGNGSSDAAEHQFGTIGGKPVYSSEMVETRAELSAVKNYVNFPEEARDPATQLLQRFIAAASQKPELFFLLRHEVKELGVQVSNDDVLSLIVNHTNPDQVKPDTDTYDAVYAGVSDMLKILARYDQVSNGIKISKPMVNHALVQQRETIQANLVQLNAQDYVAKTPAPTTQEVTEQFARFSDVQPHHPTPATNPFGFGYKLPLRAKLQYFRISADAVEAAVIATVTDPYYWKLTANKYYLSNKAEFFPASATTAPTTMPVVLQDQVLQKVRHPQVAALMDQVQGFVSTTLNNDYQNYVKSIGSAEPDSSLGVKYSSFTYLSKLIEKVKSKFNVTLVAGESPDYLSEDQIGSFPGVGSASLVDFISKEATAYLAKLDAKDPVAAGLLLRPSAPLQGSQASNGLAIVRMTAALPSQAPTDVDVARPLVINDLRLAAAYKLAQADAVTLLNAAKAGTFLAVAPATGHQIISLDNDSALSLNSNEVKGVYPPVGDAAPSFMRQAFDLLNTYNPVQNPHPAQTIELPEQARLFVAQLTAVNVGWNAQNYFVAAFHAAGEANQELSQILAGSWFDFNTVARRLAFEQPKGKS